MTPTIQSHHLKVVLSKREEHFSPRKILSELGRAQRIPMPESVQKEKPLATKWGIKKNSISFCSKDMAAINLLLFPKCFICFTTKMMKDQKIDQIGQIGQTARILTIYMIFISLSIVRFQPSLQHHWRHIWYKYTNTSNWVPLQRTIRPGSLFQVIHDVN